MASTIINARYGPARWGAKDDRRAVPIRFKEQDRLERAAEPHRRTGPDTRLVGRLGGFLFNARKTSRAIEF